MIHLLGRLLVGLCGFGAEKSNVASYSGAKAGGNLDKTTEILNHAVPSHLAVTLLYDIVPRLHVRLSGVVLCTLPRCQINKMGA
jgi:hypothetical protein